MTKLAQEHTRAAMKRPTITVTDFLCSTKFCVGIVVGFFLHGFYSQSFIDLDLLPSLRSLDTSKKMVMVDDHQHDLPPLYRSSNPVQFESLQRSLDVYNPIHQYLQVFDEGNSNIADFPDLPLFHTWIHYPEAYHNHFARFRGKERIIFMEVGVQSGGKIPMLRDYFGPGFVYIGIDINPSTKMFESADWVNIEIGNSGDPAFWRDIVQKYPVVDIFLDDGGHKMHQQRLAMEFMLPHVQPDGIYMCEDLATSWARRYGGKPGGGALDPKFVKSTMHGLILQSFDCLHAGFVFGATNGATWNTSAVPSEGGFGKDWWSVVTNQVKHIHYYNQVVVYEKGLTFPPANVRTVGTSIPYANSGDHEPVDWDTVMKKVQSFTKSNWDW